MRRYIKIWLVIILVVDLLTFVLMILSGGSFITRNKEYEKVYCDDPIPIAYSADDGPLENYSEWYREHAAEIEQLEKERREPSLRVSGTTHSDFIYFFEIHSILNIVLAGTAVILYIVFSNIHDRPGVSIGFAIFFVAFLVGAAYVGHLYHQYIKQPGKIVGEVHYAAPIIYLYDEQEREANVKLDLKGDLTCTYPKYDEKNGWTVKTSADGVLTDKNGRQYEYLYWEADVDMVPDFSKGFCIRGEDSAAFLEKALSDLGLSDTEANAFIMYWLPDFEENPYNVIAFQTDTYEDVAKLDVDPLPDTVVRVNMLFYGSDEYVDMVEQDLAAMNPSLEEREGFVLVEWGGGKLG